MNQQDKLIQHISLLEKGIKPADKIRLCFRKQTKPYSKTRTIFSIEVFELENRTYGMVISATKTTPSGYPSGVAKRTVISAPEIDTVTGSILLPGEDSLMPHTLVAFGGNGETTFKAEEQLPSVVKLSCILRYLDVVALVVNFATPYQDIGIWIDPDMLEALQEEWDALRSEAIGELALLLLTGAR